MAVLTGRRGALEVSGEARKSMACSSPTGRPPPSTGAAAMPAKGDVSTSSAASRLHGDGHPGAVSAVGDLHGDGTAVRQSHQLDAFEAVLGQESGHQAHQCGDIPVLARDHLGVAAHGAGDGGFRAAGSRGRGQPAEGPGHAAQGKGEERGAAAVSGRALRFLAGQVRDGPGHELLERVRRVQVSRDRPAVDDAGGGHGRVLSGAVLRQPGGLSCRRRAIPRARGRRKGGRCCSRGRRGSAHACPGCAARRRGGRRPRSGWRMRGRGVRPGVPGRHGPWRRPAGA